MKTAVLTHGETVSRAAWIWPAALAAMIFWLSSQSHLPDVSGGIPNFDKFEHASAYGLLGVLICRTGRGPRRALLAVVLASAYGVSDEWHQSFVPGRNSDVFDWLADTLGAAVAVACYAGSPRLRYWMETPARVARRILDRVKPVSLP